MWGTGRILSEVEREKIKENKAKEREYNRYITDSIDRMKPKDTKFKRKTYKEC